MSQWLSPKPSSPLQTLTTEMTGRSYSEYSPNFQFSAAITLGLLRGQSPAARLFSFSAVFSACLIQSALRSFSHVKPHPQSPQRRPANSSVPVASFLAAKIETRTTMIAVTPVHSIRHSVGEENNPARIWLPSCPTEGLKIECFSR